MAVDPAADRLAYYRSETLRLRKRVEWLETYSSELEKRCADIIVTLYEALDAIQELRVGR